MIQERIVDVTFTINSPKTKAGSVLFHYFLGVKEALILERNVKKNLKSSAKVKLTATPISSFSIVLVVSSTKEHSIKH